MSDNLDLLLKCHMLDTSSAIAVVGIAAQLPRGEVSQQNGDLDYESFFEFLMQRGEAYTKIPEERFNTQYLRGSSVGRVVTDHGAFLTNLDQLDFMEFGMTPRDAQAMPLSTRKLVELSFLSLLDSGIDYRSKNVGCYMAGIAHDMFAVSGHDDSEVKGSFSYAYSMLANRVSYHLDLRGPSVPVDTACSSSLYATHLAIQALRNGECEAAVVGGSQINHRFTEWLTYSQGGVLAPDGKCKPFDETANGFGRGEGVVVVVLKPLEDAMRDRDKVYATILGTGVNSSGSLVPANAPSAQAQRDAMQRAFLLAGRDPRHVDFLELHATGTAKGDPTEANWVGDAFQRDGEIIIGSVKGNIGHLEITAFLASLCKVCGIFSSGVIPPNVNVNTPNPSIEWSKYRLRVPMAPEPLGCRSGNGRSLIAMTSSGIGGANGHAVVEGPPPAEPIKAFWVGDAVPVLLVAAGLSPRSTSAVGETWLAEIERTSKAASLARIAGRRARSMTWRSVAVFGENHPPMFGKPTLVPKVAVPIVFVFSGQGTQYFDMGRTLFRTCVPFRESILELDQVYASVVGTSLVESTGLFQDSEAHPTDTLGDPWPIAITLPALTMLQLALVDALAVAGVRPDVVVGHSAGETAVLSASGAASKIVALKLAIARGRALALLEDTKGTMAAVSCSPTQAKAIIDEVKAELGDGVLEVGCYNTADAVTLSGQETHVEAAVAKATAARIFARRLKTRIPVHSAMMELCRAEFMRLLADIFPTGAEACVPKVATYSTVTGALFEGVFDTDYYWDGTLKPVLFQDAIEAMLRRYKGATFVEIGPHPVLVGYLRTMAEGFDNIMVTCPLRRARKPQPSTDSLEFLTTLGHLVVAGHNCVDFDALYGCAGRFTGSLPKYPFVPKTLPWVINTPEIVRQRQHRNGPLNYPQLQVNAKTHPELADHVVKGEPIMPGSGFIEMALEFGATELYDVEFHRMLPLSSDRPTPIQINLSERQWTVLSASPTDSGAWPIQYTRRHASGYLSMEPTLDDDAQKLDIESIRAGMKLVNIDGFYPAIEHFLQYGPSYRRIQECHINTLADGTVEALVRIRGRDEDLPNIADYVFHPAVMDAAVHVVAHPLLTGNYDRDVYHLPDKVATFRTYPRLREGPFPEVLYAKATTVSWRPDAITFDIVVYDELGSPLSVFQGLEVARHGYSAATVSKRYDVVYEPVELTLPVHQESIALDMTLSQDPHQSTEALTVGDHEAARSTLVPISSRSSSSEWDSATQSSEFSSEVGDKGPCLIMDYVRGEETRLQAPLAALKAHEPASILFVARDGPDGDAALGFTRCLRREYLAWTIRLAVYDSALTKAQQIRCSDLLASLPATDMEMRIDADGAVHVPRITLVDGPSEQVPFDPGMPWVVREGQLVHTRVPAALSGQCVVHVSAVDPHGPVWAFVGTLHGSSQVVVGVASGALCSHIEVHEKSLACVDCDMLSDKSVGPSVLAPTISALPLGPGIFSDPSRLQGKTALVFAGADDQLHEDVYDVLKALGMTVSLTSSLSSSALKPFYKNKPHVIFSGTRDTHDMALLRTLLAPSGRAFFWNDMESGIIRALAEDPWAVGDALHAAVKHSREQGGRAVYYTPLLDALRDVLPVVKVARPPSLFDPGKTYLLIGGIGSLGLHIALWMYENGARSMILTSRSGPAGLRKRGDFIALRILDYLQSREDLVLCTPSADATSLEQLQSVLKDVAAPLGGAFILAWLLNDRSFAAQTQESFDSVFPSKVDAFTTLSQATDIASLEFCIALSSVSAVFGNRGQTNYAAANTALSGMARKYRNAFSMVCPIILDSGVLTLKDDAYRSRVRHTTSWGMTARELCSYIGDGIRKLRDGPVWQYVPDFDWRVVRDNMGPSQLYDYLAAQQQQQQQQGGDSDGSPGDGRADRPSLVQIVCKVLDLQEADVSPDVPLTAYGLDSLSAAALSFALRSLLAVSQLQLLADLAISDLQARIDAAEADGGAGRDGAARAPEEEDREGYVEGRVREMRGLLSELGGTLDARAVPQGAPREREREVALVTGTTGSLGSHILAELLAAPVKYEKVIALVRPGQNGRTVTAKERQLAAFESRGLDVALLDSQRLVLVDCPFEGKHLGIDPAVYEELVKSVSHIIHVAWPMSFALPLSSFKNALFALREMVDLASEARAHGPVSMLFGSTSGIFRNYTESVLPTEQPLEPAMAVGQGYSESKWVAEQLMKLASERTAVHTTIVRIGQIAGGPSGVWNASEWLPAMISASAVLKSLPGGQGPISWLPVHVAASAIIEMASQAASASAHNIVHLRHPHPITWPDIMAHFSAVLGWPVVDYAAWIAELSTLHERPGTYNAKVVNAAVSLLGIFPSGETSMPASVAENNGLSVLMALGESSLRFSVLRGDGVEQLGIEDVRKWVDYWRRTGSLPSGSV